MSITLIDWALSEPIPPAPKLLLVAICDKISDEPGHEYFWGSQKYLAQKLNIGDRQVRNHMKTLEKLGYIRREKRTTSSGTYQTDAIYVDTSGRKLPLEENGQNQRKKTSTNTLEDPLANNKPAKKVSVPDNFPDEEALERAKAYWKGRGRTDLSPQEQAEAFRDHHLAHNKKMTDWMAAWRTWCRNACEFNKAPKGQTIPFKSSEPKNRVEIWPGTPEWQAWKEHDKPLPYFQRLGQSGPQDWWEGSRVLKPSKFPENERKSA